MSRFRQGLRVALAAGILVLAVGCASAGLQRGHTAEKASRPWGLRMSSPERGKSASTYQQLAQKYHQQKRPEVARQLYETALLRSPGDPRLHYLLAHALGSTGRWKEGIEHARTAVRLEPEYTEAKLLLAVLLRRQGSNDEAIKLLEENWRSENPSLTAGVELAKWHLARGETDWALPILETARRRWPGEERIVALLEKTSSDAVYVSTEGEGNGSMSSVSKPTREEFPPLMMGESFP